MDKNDYRETGTIFRRSPLVSPEGQGFAAKVRAVVADHARSLQSGLERAKRQGGRYTQGLAGRMRTTLPGGVLVETWINPFGLTPTIMARVVFSGKPELLENVYWMHHGYYSNTDGRVYIPQEIEEYLSNPDSMFSWGLAVENGVIVNYKVWTPSEVDDEKGYSIPNFNAPDNPNIYPPSWSSGLGVAYWQAVAGSNSPGKRPPGWNSAKEVALVRSPTGRYWLTRFSDHELSIARMAVPSDLQELDSLIYTKIDGVFVITGLDRAFAMSFVLAHMAWDGKDPIVLLESSQLDASIFDKSAQDPFGWGLQWNWQDLDADDAFDAKALITVYRQLNCYPPPSAYCDFMSDCVTISRECLITINWDAAGTPLMAELDITESGPWKLSGKYDPFAYGDWYWLLTVFYQMPDGFGSRTWGWDGALSSWNTNGRYDTCPGGENTRSATLCSWFKKDGSIFRIISDPWYVIKDTPEAAGYAVGGVRFGDGDVRPLRSASFLPALGKQGTILFSENPRTVHFYASDYAGSIEEDFNYTISADVEYWVNDFHSDPVKLAVTVLYDEWGTVTGFEGSAYLSQVLYAYPGEGRYGFTHTKANASCRDNFWLMLMAESPLWNPMLDSLLGSCIRWTHSYIETPEMLVYSPNVTKAEAFSSSSQGGLWVGAA